MRAHTSAPCQAPMVSVTQVSIWLILTAEPKRSVGFMECLYKRTAASKHVAHHDRHPRICSACRLDYLVHAQNPHGAQSCVTPASHELQCIACTSQMMRQRLLCCKCASDRGRRARLCQRAEAGLLLGPVHVARQRQHKARQARQIRHMAVHQLWQRRQPPNLVDDCVATNRGSKADENCTGEAERQPCLRWRVC